MIHQLSLGIAMLEKRVDESEPALTRYVYSNHLQSASLELDQNAAIISYEEYHPYGTTAFQAKSSTINAVAKRYRYTGKERDEESGLYYHGARYYIPWLCRWVSVDPMESKYAGMSPYNYSFNNPVMWNDPSGADPDGVPMASVVQQSDGSITATANKMKEGQKEEAISTYSYSGSADIPPSDIQTVKSTSYFHLGSDKFARGWYKESEYVKMMGDVMLGAVHSVTGDTPFGLAISSRYGGDVAMAKADKAFEDFRQSGSASDDFISLIDKYSSKLIHDFKNDYAFRQSGVAYLTDSPIDLIGPGALKLAFSGAKASINFMRSSITTFNTTSKNLMMKTSTTMAERAFSLEATSLNLLESTTNKVMPNAVGANSLEIKAVWINHNIWNKLPKNMREKFRIAMNKGFASNRENSSGIIWLKAHEVLEKSGNIYEYKIKITGKGMSHYRLYGRLDNNGALVFDYPLNIN